MRVIKTLGVVIFVVAVALCGIAIGQVSNYYSTTINDAEISIVRPDGLLSHFEYAESRVNGDRKLKYLHGRGNYEEIEYTASCKCVKRYFRIQDGDLRGVTIVPEQEKDGKVLVTTGKSIIIAVYLPKEAVQPDLDHAQAKIDEVRAKYASIINP